MNMENRTFPDLHGWDPTRDSLHLYAQAIGVIPRALAEPHPKWWHIGLKVQEDGPTTDPISIPGEKTGSLVIQMDLRQHNVIIATTRGESAKVDMRGGLTGSEFGDQLILRLADLGVEGEFDRARYDDQRPREYEPRHAERYLQALLLSRDSQNAVKEELAGETGPVQLWPHHFDLSFEWFGTKIVAYEEEGEEVEASSQLNFGFAPGDEGHPAPYFYSNPWPFEESLTDALLPEGARWETDSYQGTLLPYGEVVGDPHGPAQLRDYYLTVYGIAKPTLMA